MDEKEVTINEGSNSSPSGRLGGAEIILRTEDVNEILTSTPKWILRWGISVIFILITVFYYFYKYELRINIYRSTLGRS